MRHHHGHLGKFLITGAVLMTVPISGCVYQYPDDNCLTAIGAEVTVHFDWHEAPEADPEGMSTLFYPVPTGRYWSFNFYPKGGKARIPLNNYNVVTYNNDTESVVVSDDSSFGTLTLTTRPVPITDGLRETYEGAPPPRNREQEEGQTVRRQPDTVWSSTAEDFHASAVSALTLVPRRVTAIYTINIINISNLHSVSKASISLSGLVGEFRPATGAKTSPAVILPGSVNKSSDSTLSGIINTFGCSSQTDRNMLRLYIWLTDGSKHVYEWEVSHQIHLSPHPMDANITVEGPDLPDLTPMPPTGSGGMEVDVDNWEVIKIELST